MTFECFEVSIADHVAEVRINRPPVNAQNTTFREELVLAFDRLNADMDIRAVILTGEGKMFSAGADLKERAYIDSSPGGYHAHNRRVRASFEAVSACTKPVIAAVNGGAIGAGCVLALCCDIIYVADCAYFSMPEVSVGMAGGVAHVRRHFSPSDARLLILSGRKISAPELLRMNVVSGCFAATDLSDEAARTAREIAAMNPLAVQAAKLSFKVTAEMPLEQGYAFEQVQTAALARAKGSQETVLHGVERQSPRS